jgi:hypothetical protein
MKTNEHGRIIASQAKAILQPQGFQRKGQSRIWIADRGFWLSVVEFQPSAWAKGSYLNVAVHWLWGQPPHVLSFDRVERIDSFIEFESAEQFLPLAARMVAEAAETAKKDWATFASMADTSAILVEAETSRAIYRGGWTAYHAGVAAGLASDYVAAQSMLESVQEPRALVVAKRLLETVNDPVIFRNQITQLIETERSHFRLPALATPTDWFTPVVR